MFYLTSSQVLAESKKDTMIIGGKSIGPVSLGEKDEKYLSFLGRKQPISSTFTNYPDRGIALLTSRGVITGIMAFTPSYKTPEGIRVGDPISKLVNTYGNYLKTNAGSLTYSELGLAFNEKDNKILRIMVIIASPDPLLGDKIIVPGYRVGKIKLGANIEEIIRSWGNPDSQEKLEKNDKIQVYKYKNKAVKFLVGSGLVMGIQVDSYKFRTPEGISVNSTLAQVKKAYGEKFKKVEDSYYFESRGIGFYIHKNKVLEILLTPRKE
jgi:hypothetical protein